MPEGFTPNKSIPEKWCIKTTPETRGVVNDFLNKNGYSDTLHRDYYCHFPLIDSGSAWSHIKKGYTEITFEQFKQHVLKETSKSETMFRAGDYIVLLDGPKKDPDFKLFYCYKQRENSICISPEIDCRGSKTNGWGLHAFDKSENNDWRYATPEEIVEYDRVGKPFDVTTLENKITNKFIVGNWYKYSDNNYIKISNVEPENGYNRLHFEERIYEGKHRYESNYWANSDMEKTLLSNEFSFSEIQKYLPDGHVDKIKIDMKIIQEEAKRRFPIGCRFRCIDGYEDTLVDDDIVYKILNNMIYASDGLGCLYKDGKWATLISMPKTGVLNTSVLGDVGYVDVSTKYNMWVDKADHIIEIKKPTPQPLLLNKTKQTKQLVNLK
jgi:hypothetical protein